jgi:hypothetical protein
VLHQNTTVKHGSSSNKNFIIMEGLALYEKVQKLYTLSIHDDRYHEEKVLRDAPEVIFNLERFPELKAQPGDLVRISPILDTVEASKTPIVTSSSRDESSEVDSEFSHPGSEDTTPGVQSITIKTYDESGALITDEKKPDTSRSYLFVVRAPTDEIKNKYANIDLSITQSVAQTFGFRKWMHVLVSVIPEEGNAVSHVEIIFRDQYLSRADMWRLAISELSQRTVHRDQKVVFLDTIKATIKNIYFEGEKQKWGFFGKNTKPIFRSESARYVVFIQMSREMWEFDVEGGGEIMFNKVVNGFLPELFKSWTSIQARHLVTIVLFTRVEYDKGETLAEADSSRFRPGYRDFYRVVVNDWSSHDWIKILTQLKREFRSFLGDVTVQQASDESFEVSNPEDGISNLKIIGQTALALKGNILEAITLASTHFSEDYIDRDLVRTGISVVVITAGTGIYEVDYSLLKQSTDTLISSGIGIDLVCLAPMPLHSVPLFKYRNPRLLNSGGRVTRNTSFSSLETTPKQGDIGVFVNSKMPLSNRLTPNYNPSGYVPGEWSYAIPHWIDVSFWKRTTEEQTMLSMTVPSSRSRRKKEGAIHAQPFNLRCVLYELEMMGFMQNEMANNGIQHVHEHPLHPWHKLRHRISGRPVNEIDSKSLIKMDNEWMNSHDAHIFKPLHSKAEAEAKAREATNILIAKRPGSIKGASSSTAIAEPQKTVAQPDPSLESSNTGYLEWKVKQERSASKVPHTPKRKSSIMSFVSFDRESIRSSSTSISRASPVPEISKAEAEVKPMLISAITPTVRGTAGGASTLLGQFKNINKKPAPKLFAFASKDGTNGKGSTPSSSNASKTIPEGDEDQKAKPIVINQPKKLTSHARSFSNDQVGSAETVKAGENHISTSVTKRSRGEHTSAIFHAASFTRRNMTKLSSSGELNPISSALSPTSALAPWLVLVNPSNPRKNNFSINSQFRRWQHVFPKRLKVSSVKWKSLTSPASVPLTNEFFPTPQQLQDEYHESVYKITQDTDEDVLESSEKQEALIKELVAFRLAHGFQLVVGPSVSAYLGRGSEEGNIFDTEFTSKDGETVFMTIGNIIHQLTGVAGGAVEIKRYTRKPPAEIEVTKETSKTYIPYIRTALAPAYIPRDVSFKTNRAEYNWNYVDSFIAGHVDRDQFSEQLRCWRARFVFIPVDVPFQGQRKIETLDDKQLKEDSEEETRLEGIRKMGALWNQDRVYAPEERGHQSERQRKDPNPLQIDYQTRDPSAVIAAGPEGSLFSEIDGNARRPGIFSDVEEYTTSNFDLQKVAQDLQSDKGIRVVDRKWHIRTYHYSFLGEELVTWLVDRFRDIETREEAVLFGQELVKKGLFKHARDEHIFRDGNFFYQIANEYRPPKSSTGWFGTRRDKSSVPPTPMSVDVPKTYPTIAGKKDDAPSINDEKDDEKGTNGTRRQYHLSRVFRFNVDPKKRSYRPEVINIHHDTLHSPDNCYHFRIDWMNTTTKFIEDAVYDWAVHAKKYGLKLVQVPISEASSVMQSRPFREPYRVKLAIPPPPQEQLEYSPLAAFGPRHARDPFALHKAILKELKFVLDFEAADSFPSDVDVLYSWGRNTYKCTQYIHRSGTMLAQITNEGDFILLPNRLYNHRMDSFKLELLDPQTRPAPKPTTGVMASPMVRPVPEPLNELNKNKTITAEQIKADVESFCHNEAALKLFYGEFSRNIPFSPIAIGSAASPSSGFSLDGHIPNLRLPPRVGAAIGGIVGVQGQASISRSSSHSSLATILSRH